MGFAVDPKKERDIAIDLLDKIGIALNFPNIQSLKYYVLDPNWITTGLYRIITSKQVSQNNGKIHKNKLTIF